MKKIALFAFALFLIATVSGQNSKKEDIRQLMDCTGMNMIGKQMVDGYLAIYKTNNGENVPGLLDTLQVIINEGMGDLMDSIAMIYEKVYTHEEIKSMIEIYRTPIGKKMIETMPMLTDLSMKAGQNWAKANSGKIQERVAPLIEKYQKKDELTFNDFYNPDEKYEYDTPGKITDSKSNNTKLKGSSQYKYSINYDSKKWDKIPNETINPLADFTLVSKNQEVYALMICEASTLTIQQLKAAAIYNMSKAAKNVKIESIGLREVNGKELLFMKLSCEINGEPYKYYNYYYSGDWGVLQFIVFSSGERFDQNIKTIEGLMSGLYVE